MSNASAVIQAGFAKAKIHLLDTNGYAKGITGTLINGADAGSYEWVGVKTADLAVPEPEKTDIVGNNRWLGAFTWPLGSSPTGTIEAAVFDHALNVALEGLKKRTIGGVELSVLGALEADPKAICAILQTDAYSRQSGYVGLAKKFGLMVPKATAQVLGISSLNQRAELTARLKLTIQNADTFPWGQALTLALEGATEGLMIPFTSDYWVDLHAFMGDGTTDDVVLDNTPAGDDTATPARVTIYSDGVVMTPTTDFVVVVATKTVTFQAGHIPAAGKNVEIFYEYV